MSPPASERAARMRAARGALDQTHLAPLERGADAAARRPYRREHTGAAVIP
jgi:hypothetical protein